MEITTAEMAAVNGVACDLLDASGRLVITPNALTLDGQTSIPADLRPGESLADFLQRHVPGVASGAWIVSISGCAVPQAMWARTYPKHGQLIACRAIVGRSALALVAVAALSYFTMGAGAGWIGGTFGVGAAGAAAIGMGLFVAGSVLINKVLGPKVPKPGDTPAAREVYSLSGQRNSARAYEPLPVLWGEMRVTPDLASQPYTWYEGEYQYLSTILLGGINVHSAADLAIGDTPITSYADVTLYYNGFGGHPNQDVPLYGNADSVAGGEFVNGGDWITRTSSVDAVVLQVDIEGQLYDMNNEGVQPNDVLLTIEARRVGEFAWQPMLSETITNATLDAIRKTYSFAVAQGQYEVRAKLGTPRWNDGGANDACKFVWQTLRTVQPDATDYSQWGRLGVKIKATGQISGSLDTLRVTYRAKPMPVWNGTAWVTATTRETGLSNPGAIILQTLRGVRDAAGNLQFGFGLTDEQIDIDGLKAFMLHCAARGYTYDKWVTGSTSLGAFCQEVALAGMGEFAWTDGSRPTVVYVASGQPISAVVNMANMLKASFSVDYTLSNAADGIEYQYVDRARKWETQTLRVAAPGVTTMLNPARITGEGVTTEAHAAVLARYHLAQSLYQYKTIGYNADIEHLDYRRLSVLSLSHDLTQWGFGGRLVGAQNVGDSIVLTLDESVPPLTTPHVGLRLPGDRDYRVFQVQALAAASNQLTLVGAWPTGVPMPGSSADNPAHDTLWCYDFKTTPGYRVRVVSMEPESDLKGARIACVPEGPEFWDYVLNGTYTPAPNQSSLPALAVPTVKNLRVTEMVNQQGDTEWYELGLTWDVEGDFDHAQVWAGRDGSEPRMVDGNAQSRSTFRIDGAGQWLIQVIPFSQSGKAGTAASVVYGTQSVALPPANPQNFAVHDLDGGLRRYVWSWDNNRPNSLAGVQIRYLPGDVAISAEQWGAMTPLGAADDIYTAHFETMRPEAGLWTFGLRAINTSGQLSPGIVRFSTALSQALDDGSRIDLTPPPDVTGLKASAMFTAVLVEWDPVAYQQGHGHARTIIYAAQGEAATFAQAAKVAEAYNGPVSFASEPDTVWQIWAKNQTVDGVESVNAAGPVQVRTAEDVAKVMDALHGKIAQDQLVQHLGERIDLIDAIDVGIPAIGLPQGLVPMTSQLATAQQIADASFDRMAEGLLQAAIAADTALERITDAGVYVDPATGQVKIYGLDATNDRVTNLQVLLDAAQGQLALKATTSYVDDKIAEAVLSPADLLMYEGLDARITSAAVELDSINATLSNKASALELQQALVRLTTAETNLDVLNGKIELRVTRQEYTADQDVLQTRLSSAEITLNALDIPGITSTVIAAQRKDKEAEKTAQALLQNILSGERDRLQASDALAVAQQQLTATINDGLSAEATARQQLAAQVSGNAAAITQEQTARADAITAEATARQQLAATVASNTAAILAEQTARANADSAEATARQQLAATVASNTAAISAEQSVRASETGTLFGRYSVKIDLNGYMTGYGLLSESNNGVNTSTFAVRADRFVIGSTGTNNVSPFVVDGGKVYINSAVIKDASIKNAMIENGTIQSAKIANLTADKIASGYLQVGNFIASSGYAAGSAGWAIWGNGNAEFNSVTVRGTVYATSGQIASWRINGDMLLSGAYTGYAWPNSGVGVCIAHAGILLGNYNTGKYLQLTREGNLYAPGLTIVNGSATFGGSLSASAINAVNTINIAGNAVSSTATATGYGAATLSVYVPPGETYEIVSIATYDPADLYYIGPNWATTTLGASYALTGAQTVYVPGSIRQYYQDGGDSTLTYPLYAAPPVTRSSVVAVSQGWHTFSAVCTGSNGNGNSLTPPVVLVCMIRKR